MYILFQILFPYRLLQNTEYSSLCYTVGPCWLSILYTTPVLLPRKSHGQRSLVGCSPWGRWELDTTERLHFHFSLSCIGEGNGNPLQCSCLENPRDWEAWWAAVYGVAQSRIWLKWLSSSSSKVSLCLSSDQISDSVMSDSLRPHESHHARPPCPSPTPGVNWDSFFSSAK